MMRLEPRHEDPDTLYHLSTLFGINSPFKEQLKEHRRTQIPPPQWWLDIVRDSPYSKVPEVAPEDYDYDLPSRGSLDETILKTLAPQSYARRMAREAAKAKSQTSQKTPEQSSRSTSDPDKTKKKTGRVKDAAIHTLRRSKRLKGRKSQTPTAPVKDKTATRTRSLPEETTRRGFFFEPGTQVIILECKKLRDEISKYLGNLVSGKYLCRKVEETPVEILEQRLEEVQNYNRAAEAKVEELSQICSSACYQQVCDEMYATVGKFLNDWERTLTLWILKQRDPENNPTPETTIVTETPGMGKFSSSEESLPLEERMRRRASLAPKGPLDFAGLDSPASTNSLVTTPPKISDETPPRLVILDGRVLDSSKKRTSKGHTPDPRMGPPDPNYRPDTPAPRTSSVRSGSRLRDATPESFDLSNNTLLQSMTEEASTFGLQVDGNGTVSSEDSGRVDRPPDERTGPPSDPPPFPRTGSDQADREAVSGRDRSQQTSLKSTSSEDRDDIRGPSENSSTR